MEQEYFCHPSGAWGGIGTISTCMLKNSLQYTAYTPLKIFQNLKKSTPYN
ncbi:8634_t:CDS:1, partial [Entrophospora sp. SA101]